MTVWVEHRQRFYGKPRDKAVALKRAEALAMFRAGKTYREIGEYLGTSPPSARRAVAAGLRDEREPCEAPRS